MAGNTNVAEEDYQYAVTKWKTKVTDENPELLKKAKEELNEYPEHRDRDIQALREMMLGEQDLRSPTDDAFLLKFLRVRKFNVERAFQLVKQYYSIRNRFPSLFTNYRPSSLSSLFKNGVFFLLPYRDQLGRAILVVRCGRWDPAKSTVDDYLALLHIFVEFALLEEETQINGIVCIVDLKDFGFIHALQITPNISRKLVALFQDCLPGRFKGFHYIFEPPFFGIVFMVIKPFLNKKLRSRIHFHGSSLNSLHDHIHPECLPEEYGGLQPSVETGAEVQQKAILELEDTFVNHIANSGYSVVGHTS